MPKKELPRHELKKELKTEREETYNDAERSATKKEKKRGIDIKNPEKRQARSATGVVQDALKSLSDASNGLQKLYAGDKAFATEERGDWKAKARAGATDLAGYFNDNKLVLEAGRPRAEYPMVQRLLDLLELAEQKGGIGDWLAQWNAMMRDPNQRTDFSRMADIAESIRAGIEFQKAMIRELDLEGLERPQKEKVEDAISLLNSIAYEISRQLVGTTNAKFEAGSKLVVARDTLKRNSDRESRAETVRQAIENQSVDKTLTQWSTSGLDGPRSETPIRKIIDPVVSELNEWNEAATQMSALVKTIGTSEYPGEKMEKSIAKHLNAQCKVVHNIGKVVEAIFNMNITLPESDRISIIGKEQLLFTLDRIASGILEKQRSFATQLKNPAAKLDLTLIANQLETVCATIQKTRQDTRLPQYYEQALTAAKAGTLREFWRNNRDSVLDNVKNLGGADAATELKKLFNENLGEKLDDWFKRQNKPEDIYGLAWQLVATLREYKESATRILNEWMVSFTEGNKRGGAQVYRESMEQILDSIIGAVAQGLDEDIKGGG